MTKPPTSDTSESFFDDPIEAAQLLGNAIGADLLARDFARRILPNYIRSDGSIDGNLGHKDLFVPSWQVRTVEDVLGSRAFVAIHLLGIVATSDNRKAQDGLTWMAAQLYEATPFLWLARMREAAEACPVPDHVVSADSLPFDRMWWVFDTPEQIEGRNLAGILVISHSDSIGIVTVGQEIKYDEEGQPWGPLIEHVVIPFGARYPDDIEPAEREYAARALALLSFLNSPHIPKIPTRMNRSLRKSLARGGWVEDESHTVQFVDLRGPREIGSSYKPRRGEPDYEEPVVREHDFRWLVRGHHRAQWYPSQQAHKVIWIAPHIKGPDGKPLKPPTYRVIR